DDLRSRNLTAANGVKKPLAQLTTQNARALQNVETSARDGADGAPTAGFHPDDVAHSLIERQLQSRAAAILRREQREIARLALGVDPFAEEDPHTLHPKEGFPIVHPVPKRRATPRKTGMQVLARHMGGAIQRWRAQINQSLCRQQEAAIV